MSVYSARKYTYLNLYIQYFFVCSTGKLISLHRVKNFFYWKYIVARYRNPTTKKIFVCPFGSERESIFKSEYNLNILRTYIQYYIVDKSIYIYKERVFRIQSREYKINNERRFLQPNLRVLHLLPLLRVRYNKFIYTHRTKTTHKVHHIYVRLEKPAPCDCISACELRCTQYIYKCSRRVIYLNIID